MSSPTDTFLQEADELLVALESALLELDDNPHDAAHIDTAFRALHTLKGSGNMFGFRALGNFIHHFEDCFEKIRNGTTAVTPELVAIALSSRDHIAALLALGPETYAPPDLAATDQDLLGRLATVTGSAGGVTPAAAAQEPKEEDPESETVRHWYIRFRPEPGSLGMGVRPDLLLMELEQLGKTTVTPVIDSVPSLDSYDPAECYITWAIELVGVVEKSAIEDVFLFQMDAELSIEEVTEPTGSEQETATSPSSPQTAATETKPAAPGQSSGAGGG